MATQLSRDARLAQADDVIDNSGPRDALAPQVARLHALYPDLATRALEPESRSRDNGATAYTTRPVIRYEHPLNERVRTLMRLEDLFARVGHFASQDAAPDHHAALLALFEITDVAARADLKTDLLQELERQKQMLGPAAPEPADRAEHARGAPGADRRRECAAARPGGQGRRPPARQRVADGDQAAHRRSPAACASSTCRLITGGCTRIPPRDATTCAAWIEPFAPIRAGAAIVLKLLRDNGRASRHIAHRGVFQLMLTTTKVAQLLRLTVARDLSCVPEISANKYALNIRFIGVSGMDRGTVFDDDVEFELMFCNL